MKSIVPERTSLEYAFPAVMISTVGTKESWRKEIYRPATSTHKWWAKRLGTVFRGIITSAVTAEHEDSTLVYKAPHDLSEAVIFDPFSGSGVIGVEAFKLGGKPICFDINPVATLVERQAMQPWDLTALTKAYETVESACREEIDRLHRTEDGRTVLYYFWVATVECPHCAATVRLFDSPVFSKHAYPKRIPQAKIVCPECLAIKSSMYDFKFEVCPNGHKISPRGSVHGQHATCRKNHTFKIIHALNGNIPKYEMYAKMVANRDGTKGYEGITAWDRDLYDECVQYLANLPDDAVIPVGDLTAGNNTSQALKWNFRQWRDFFNARQLVSLSRIATAIRDIPGFTPEREALAVLFSGTLEFNNLFASFKGEGTGAVRHMFSHHILRPERTPLEAHPWGTSQSSGSFSTLYKSRLYRAHEYKVNPLDLVVSQNEVQRVSGIGKPLNAKICRTWDNFVQADDRVAYIATRNSAETDLPEASVDLVVTDPPYMDNVHYAELADFFHAWLQGIRPHAEYLESTTTRVKGEVQNADSAEFGKAIEAVWAECARVLKPGGILVFTFHQARISGWIQVIESLRRAGFVVTAVQPVKGEMTTSVVKSGSREPSNLDSIVVCRKANETSINMVDTLENAHITVCNKLLSLRDAGIKVGVGDIRSVVRGSLLSNLAFSGYSLDEAVLSQVEELVNQAINLLEAPSKKNSAIQLKLF